MAYFTCPRAASRRAARLFAEKIIPFLFTGAFLTISGDSLAFSGRHARSPAPLFQRAGRFYIMKPNSGKAERIVRFGLGLLISAIGSYTLFVNLWLGIFVIAVGVFTVYEGLSGWTMLREFIPYVSNPEPEKEEIEFFS